MMKKRLFQCVSAFFLMAICASSNAGGAPKQYCSENPRFCIAYPHDFTEIRSPRNEGNVHVFVNRNSTVRITFWNRLVSDLAQGVKEQHQALRQKNFDVFYYDSQYGDFWLYSGKDGKGNVIYGKFSATMNGVCDPVSKACTTGYFVSGLEIACPLLQKNTCMDYDRYIRKWRMNHAETELEAY